jgi:hypothetical protein
MANVNAENRNTMAWFVAMYVNNKLKSLDADLQAALEEWRSRPAPPPGDYPENLEHYVHLKMMKILDNYRHTDGRVSGHCQIRQTLWDLLAEVVAKEEYEQAAIIKKWLDKHDLFRKVYP